MCDTLRRGAVRGGTVRRGGVWCGAEMRLCVRACFQRRILPCARNHSHPPQASLQAPGIPAFIATGSSTIWVGATSISDYDPDYMPLGTTKLRFTLDQGPGKRGIAGAAGRGEGGGGGAGGGEGGDGGGDGGVPASTGTIRGSGVSSYLNVHIGYDLIGSFDLGSRLVCLCVQAHPVSGSMMQRVRRYVGFFDASGTAIRGDYAHGSFELVKREKGRN